MESYKHTNNTNNEQHKTKRELQHRQHQAQQQNYQTITQNNTFEEVTGVLFVVVVLYTQCPIAKNTRGLGPGWNVAKRIFDVTVSDTWRSPTKNYA
eukprot:2071215-Amphidinium_carterae.1